MSGARECGRLCHSVFIFSHRASIRRVCLSVHATTVQVNGEEASFIPACSRSIVNHWLAIISTSLWDQLSRSNLWKRVTTQNILIRLASGGQEFPPTNEWSIKPTLGISLAPPPRAFPFSFLYPSWKRPYACCKQC